MKTLTVILLLVALTGCASSPWVQMEKAAQTAATEASKTVEK